MSPTPSSRDDAKAATTEARASAAATKGPLEWAKALGFSRQVRKLDGSLATEPGWQHAAAAALHGWAEHEHHAAAPMLLSEVAYRAALSAAAEPDAAGAYAPHEAALSPHAPPSSVESLAKTKAIAKPSKAKPEGDS